MASDTGLRQAVALTLAILVLLSVGGATLARRVDVVDADTPQASPGSRAPAECVSVAAGDFDGDLRADTATISARDPSACASSSRGAFTLSVRTAAGETVSRKLGACRSRCAIAGASDFNNDLRQELLVRLSVADDGSAVTVYSLLEGRLERAELRRDPVVFRIGGALAPRTWVACADEDGRRVVQRVHAELASDAPGHWLIQVQRLIFDGKDFVTLGFREYLLAVDDPAAFELGGSGNEEICPTV